MMTDQERQAKRAEYDRLWEEVFELQHTRGVDDPAYQKKAARMDELASELGLENDPGIDPDD
jgi:hypothetical protein